MSILDDIIALASFQPIKIGYSVTGQRVPFIVARPLTTDDNALSVAGEAIDWDDQHSFYCAGGSVEASYNLAIDLMRDLQGKRAGGTTLSTSMGYIGAVVEGHYETQVTVQLNRGGI